MTNVSFFKLIFRLVAVVSCFGFINANAKPALIPAPPQVAASSYVLMDATTGDIIVEENSNEALPPASLTKMMTAYIVESEISRGNITLHDEVPVSNLVTPFWHVGLSDRMKDYEPWGSDYYVIRSDLFVSPAKSDEGASSDVQDLESSGSFKAGHGMVTSLLILLIVVVF